MIKCLIYLSTIIILLVFQVLRGPLRARRFECGILGLWIGCCEWCLVPTSKAQIVLRPAAPDQQRWYLLKSCFLLQYRHLIILLCTYFIAFIEAMTEAYPMLEILDLKTRRDPSIPSDHKAILSAFRFPNLAFLILDNFQLFDGAGLISVNRHCIHF